MKTNRIRTAAIAGAVALATSLSVVTVAPAVAADNTGNHFNVEDGSAPQQGTVRTEQQLKDATDAISKFLVKEQSPRDEVQQRYLEMFAYKNAKELEKEGALSPDEKSTMEAFEAAHADITAQLAQAAKNVADARASVASALADDQKARESLVDLDAKFQGIHNAHLELNKLIEAVNKENKTGLPNLPLLSVNPETKKSATNVAEVRELLLAKDNHVVNLNNYAEVDKSADAFVSRQYMEAFDALLKNPALIEFQKALTDTNEAVIQAEKHDVIVLQLALARANAQVQALRAIQASFSTVATYIDLYENDTLFPDYKNGWQTLRPEYKEAIPVLQAAVNTNYANMQAADADFQARFDGFNNDLKNDNDWKKDEELNQYYTERAALAQKNYNEILSNGDWQMVVEKLQLKLGKFGKDAVEAARVEAEKVAQAQKEAEQAAKDAERLEADKRAQETRDMIRDLMNPAKVDKPSDTSKGSADAGSSNFDMKGLGIFAVIAAIIGAIVAALPHIAQFLPKA